MLLIKRQEPILSLTVILLKRNFKVKITLQTHNLMGTKINFSHNLELTQDSSP